MTLSYGFEPIIPWHAKILILGSIPGVESVQILTPQRCFIYSKLSDQFDQLAAMLEYCRVWHTKKDMK